MSMWKPKEASTILVQVVQSRGSSNTRQDLPPLFAAMRSLLSCSARTAPRSFGFSVLNQRSEPNEL